MMQLKMLECNDIKYQQVTQDFLFLNSNMN